MTLYPFWHFIFDMNKIFVQAPSKIPAAAVPKKVMRKFLSWHNSLCLDDVVFVNQALHSMSSLLLQVSSSSDESEEDSSEESDEEPQKKKSKVLIRFICDIPTLYFILVHALTIVFHSLLALQLYQKLQRKRVVLRNLPRKMSPLTRKRMTNHPKLPRRLYFRILGLIIIFFLTQVDLHLPSLSQHSSSSWMSLQCFPFFMFPCS